MAQLGNEVLTLAVLVLNAGSTALAQQPVQPLPDVRDGYNH